jgi:putative transposase
VRATALGINRKNIYRVSRQELKDQKLKEQILKVHEKHPAYGHRRVALDLKLHEEKVRRVMRKYSIKPPRRKVKHDFCTTSIPYRKYPNILQDLEITYENQVWVSDTSEFKFHGNKWYIVTIIDIFTRQVLGVSVGRHHNSELVFSALKATIQIATITPVIFHSDQGTEFMAEKITAFLERQGTLISASDKASPWQNGYQESFFGRFKEEFGDINRFEVVGELLEEIYHQIHYYNNERIHTSLKMPPAVYAKQFS